MLGVKYIEKEGLLGVYEAGFYYFSFQICVTTSDWEECITVGTKILRGQCYRNGRKTLTQVQKLCC